jgi:hypothetical protein
MEAKKKYTFKQFIAALDSQNFDELDPNAVASTKSYFQKLNDLDFTHIEDAGQISLVCDLCILENYLKEYRIYQFDEAYYRKEYLGE